MATSLQRQLAALATPSSALLIPDRKVSSILFTPQEAAKHKREVFYEIGLDGLYELIKVNPALFKKFLTSPLFDESSKKYERIVADKEANKRLDNIIEEFLVSLSPYLMLKASLKCLEWLVNRFHIEKFNVELIMKCIIPYFDTKTFSLVVQVLQVDVNEKKSSRWEWILPNIKTALPISKPDLYAQCNPRFLVWIFSTFYKFIEYHEATPENLRVFISFMTATFSGVLNRTNIDLQNVHNSKIMKTQNNACAIVACLWSQLAKLSTICKKNEKLKHNEEIQAMVYIVCTVLYNTASGNKALQREEFRGDIQRLMFNVLKSHPRSLKTQAYLLVNLLSSTPGNVIALKKVPLRRALNEISLLSSDWDLWHLASKLILHNSFNEEFHFSLKVLWNFISAINFTMKQRSHLLTSLYTNLCSKKTPKRFRTWKEKFLIRYEREYPSEFEIACDSNTKFSSTFTKFRKGKNFFLLVQHSNPEIRQKAVGKLIHKFKLKYLNTATIDKPTTKPSLKVSKKGKKSKKVDATARKMKKPKTPKPISPDTNKTAKALLPRFQDDDYEIVHLLIRQDMPMLTKMFSIHTLIEQLGDIITRKDCNKTCLKTALSQLCRAAEHISSSDSGKLTSKVFAIFVPFLFPTSSFKFKLSMSVLTSEFATKNAFLRNYSKIASKENATSQEICDFSYIAVTSLLDQELFGQNFGQNPTSAVSAVFTLLTWNSTTKFNELMDRIEKVNFKPFSTSWSLTKQNFPKCLRQATSKNSLALELILTTLFRLNLTNMQDIQRVVTFVLCQCEKLESRNICAEFLKSFLNRHFANETNQLQFWLSMIVSINKNFPGSSPRVEFLSLRILQCFYFSLKRFAEHQDESKLECKNLSPGLVEVILTQCIDHDSPRLREWGLNCMEAFAGLAIAKDSDSEFALYITGYRGEIVADKEQVPVVVTKALQMEEFVEIRDRFIRIIVDESFEEILGTGLLKMFRFTSSTIFAQFFPLAKELLKTDPSSRKLLAILNCFDGTLTPDSYAILVEALKHKASCLIMLSKMAPKVFLSYEDTTKKKLIALFIDTVLFSEDPEIKVTIQRRVAKWYLDANIISSELDKCIRMEKLLNSAATGAARRSSRRKSEEALSLSVFGNVEWTNRTEVVLEFAQSEKRLKQKSKLILPLFKLLKTCIALEEQSPVEYLKQLILTTLTLCCGEDGVDEKANMDDWVHFNAETVIDCLRCSRNPQTHHHALILLNYAARKYPEQVLHGVMSLFTFMGNSILRQDDSYSTQLIQQTVTTIIPTLANETSARQFSKSLVSAGIFRVFTSAVQDIPVHRRVPVFISLVETLDPKDTMWQVCIIIIDNALTRDKKRSHLNADMELATDIVWHFDADIVLASLTNVYTYLMDLPIFKKNITEGGFARIKNTQDPHSKSLIDLSRKETLRDAEIIVLFTVELLSKICDKFMEFDENQKLSYDHLLQTCLAMAKRMASNQENKIMRLIGIRNMEVIEKVNAALNPSEFIRVTISIIVSDDTTIKKKMLDLLNQRILHQVEWFKDKAVLLELIPHLGKLGIGNTTPQTEDQVTLVQTALLSLKLIGRHLAALHPEEFVLVFELANEHTRHKNKLLRASGLLCLGELFSLKSLILPKLADVSSSILRAFKASAKLNAKAISSITEDGHELDQEGETSVSTANLLCISAMTCLNKFVEQLGPFLGSSFLQKALIAVFSIEDIFGHGTKAENRRKVFEQRLKTLLKTLSSKIPFRSSLVIIKDVFTKLEDVEDYNRRSKSLLLLIGLLKETLLTTAKPDFTAAFSSLSDIFLEQMLPHREKASASGVPIEKVDEVENSILDCLVSGMILKISEGAFRPFYHKMFDWASDSLPRLITFFRLSTVAAEKLKSLFVTFAGFVVHEGSKRLTEDGVLTQAILSYFHQIFLHDKEGFVTIERFNALVKPLVDLIESEYLLKGDISIQQLNETLIKLAVASNDLNRWQHMIDLLSLKTRHEDPKVRLFVVSTIEAAATELGKDFLPLLPPAVPFLAEMLDDDDFRVKTETRNMLQKLEDLLGESLQPYFSR